MMATDARDIFFRRSPGQTLAVLHPAFALTGICHAIAGPVLPSLATAFHLNDSQAGLLLFTYFAGTSLGALFCGGRHARTLTLGFLALALAALAVAATNRVFVYPVFLLFGIGVGMPMTAVSMLAGREFGARSAAPLTFLNFSWSAGALFAPLLAARILVHHTFRAAYVILACASLIAAIACGSQVEEPPGPEPIAVPKSRIVNLRFIMLFALLAFLEVGVENTAASWLTTYVLRTAGTAAARAAAASSFYWCGFLVSRGISSLLLLRADAGRLLRGAVLVGIVAGIVLVVIPGTSGQGVAMVILGAALAPVFPLLLARFFAEARDSSDSRWVLSLCGFGGSVLPWLAGAISGGTGSLRLGLIVVPSALLAILCTLPLTGVPRRETRDS
jgi:fucose permease